MKMGKLEKTFVNRKNRAAKNSTHVERLFRQIDLSRVAKVLEIGCGIGALASYLAGKYGWKIVGIDVDPEQIAIARKENEESDRLKFYEGDAATLSFEKNEFDMVLSFHVLHHIPNWDEAFVNIGRSLKPAGVFLLSDLVLPGILAGAFKVLLKKSMGVYTLADIENGLKANGLEIVYEEKPAGYLPMRHFSIVSKKNSTSNG